MPSLELVFHCGEQSLSVRRFAIREALGTPFEVHIEARSPNDDLDIDRIVGFDAGFHVRTGLVHATREDRSWLGICREMELVQVEPTGLSTYSLTIVPRLWLLGKRRRHRVFQHLSVVDIATQLLTEWRIDTNVHVDRAVHPCLPMKVQYGETDLAFLQRILEDAGITLMCTTKGVVLADRPHAAPHREGGPLRFVDQPNESAEREYITRVRYVQRVVANEFAVRDVDFRRGPAFDLLARAAAKGSDGLEHFDYRPGAFLIETSPRGDTPVADAHGAAVHDERAGMALAERRLEEAASARRVITFATNTLDLAPGVVFTIDGHPRADLSAERKLLVTHFTLEGAEGEAWSMQGSAAFADIAYRPPRVTPKPDVRGVESAVVVGPEGEEIHTDEFGRVRIQFAWDREGKPNELNSCFVRVSQAWAGSGHGFVTIPRVGQEVLVGFLTGDPDQPVVVGRLHGGNTPVPYKLPENKAVSGIRTATSPHSGGYNELRFDDSLGRELVHVQAERNLTKVVKADETERTGKTRVIEVGERLVLTNGHVSIVLDGENLTIESKGKISMKSTDANVVIEGMPHVLLNPPPEATGRVKPKVKTKQAKVPKPGVRAERYSEGVELFGTAAFRQAARGALDALWKTRTGRSVLRKMARTGYMARIGETSAPNGACKAMRVEDAGMDANGKPGKGCASVILFNPKFVPAGSKAEVVLCKQLVHALMNALGKRATGLIRGERAADLQALGVAPYPRRAPTENSLRKELGLPERTGT